MTEKPKTSFNTHVSSSYLPEVSHKTSYGSSVDKKINQFVGNDTSLSNKPSSNGWYTIENEKIFHNGVVSSEKSTVSKQQELKVSKKDTHKDETNHVKPNFKKDKSVQNDAKTNKNKEHLKKDSSKKVQSYEEQDIKNLDTNASLSTKIKKSKPNLSTKQTKFHYLSSDDEGIYTSPYASPTGSLSPQPPQNIKKHKKSKKSASGSDGDPVDGYHKR